MQLAVDHTASKMLQMSGLLLSKAFGSYLFGHGFKFQLKVHRAFILETLAFSFM